MLSLDQGTNSLLMLIILQNSAYLQNWHPFSQALLEALDGYHGPYSSSFLSNSDPISNYVAGTMADIIFDLIVTVEIERRRDPTRRSQTSFLKPLLKRVAFYINRSVEQPQGVILSRICASAVDESRDELDLLHCSTW